MYTIRDVVDEIRDQNTKQRLRVLPYELKMVEPSSESLIKGCTNRLISILYTVINFLCFSVTEFSKKTGDYASLSATDMKVLALAYQLEVEANGVEHIKTEPTIKKSVVVGAQPQASEKVEKIAGFFMPKADEVDTLAEQVADVKVNEEPIENPATEKEHLNDSDFSDDSEQSEEEEEEDDDEGGWITPGNIAQVKNSINGVLETVQLDVACLTTDFAMQVNIDIRFYAI